MNIDPRSKIKSILELQRLIAAAQSEGRIVVFGNGCFDLIHVGHVRYLQGAKALGDLLVVGINSDASVKIIKGPDRPIHNQVDRATVLGAMESVDCITVFDEPDPLKLIEKVRPDVLVKGRDWEKKGVVGADFVRSYGGKVVLAPLVEGKSSTQVIEKMKSLAAKKKREGKSR